MTEQATERCRGAVLLLRDLHDGDLYTRVTSTNPRLIGLICMRCENHQICLGMPQGAAGCMEHNAFDYVGNAPVQMTLIAPAGSLNVTDFSMGYSLVGQTELVDGDLGIIESFQVEGDHVGKLFQRWGDDLVVIGVPDGLYEGWFNDPPIDSDLYLRAVPGAGTIEVECD